MALHILEKLAQTNPNCEIWWDSSPLAYNQWADVEQPFNKMQQAIANRLLESKQTIPHFYLMTERHLSGMAWQYQQRGFTLDHKDRHIATVLAGIKRKHARPPVQKEAVLADDIRAMVAALPFDLRGLRSC